MGNVNKTMVTGGAGFIGSELVRQLSDAGREVVVVDNLVNGKRENLDGVLGGRITLAIADIRDRAAMKRLLAGVDVVYHLACLGVRHSIHAPYENHEVNVTGTLGLLAAAREAGVPRFVYVSSSEVYGNALTAPMTEEHPIYPRTVYGASKFAGECYARAFWSTYGYPTVVVRPFNAYGPRSHHEGDSGEVIPKFVLRCLARKPMVIFGDGTQTRDFTFVSDTARGILLAGMTDKAVGQTMNLGSGTEVSIGELAKLVARTLNREGAEIVHDQPRPGDVVRLCADSSRSRQLLGFQPTVALQEGIRQLHDWYCESAKNPASLLEEEVVHNWESAGRTGVQ